MEKLNERLFFQKEVWHSLFPILKEAIDGVDC
jgi:hypothetical protein